MGSSRPTTNAQKIAAFQIAAEIQMVLADCEVDAALSALNYCMATLINDHLDGSEEALAHSDEQTRYVAQVLRTERQH